LADAGSKPATSTKHRNALNHSKPTQTSNHAVCAASSLTSLTVSNGLDRASSRHNFVTSVQSLSSSLDHLGTHECRAFRTTLLSKHFTLADGLCSNYAEIAKSKSYVEANRNLLNIDKRLCIHDLKLSDDEASLKDFCKRQANECRIITERLNYNATALQECTTIAAKYQINAPKPKDYSGDAYPCLKRLMSDKWWRRKILRLQRKTIESVARDLGMVCQQRSAYASQKAIDKRQRQKLNNREYLESTYIENELGQRYALSDLHDKSVSNPRVRRAELMTRIKGFEMVADQLGHVGEFYTITTPSRMHARLKRGGRNPNYDGTTPDQAHRHLTDLFCCIRAKLHREGLDIYGLRVVEPNHDGTPHWHLLLFMPESSVKAVRHIFKDYALRDSPNEKGARKHRFTAKAIDPTRGSAAGYVAKYISKNIDGEHISTDLNGNDSTQTASAIDAWASTYNIRQFQFLGGPSVTVWRELRRLANSPEALPPDYPSSLHQAIEACDSAEWAAYVMLMGGPNMRKSDRPIQTLYEPRTSIDYSTGEIDTEQVSQYGDIKAPKLVGITVQASQIITRLRRWTIVAAKAAAGAGGRLAPPPRAAALDLCQ